MKYICLGYLEPGKFENMSESERNTVLDECFSYNDELRKNGHLVAEEPLQPANTAVTVCWKNGKVAVTDGPYAETKEQLGGIQVLEARDLNHAIQLISQCPGVKLKCGTIEIRPAADINEIMRESERRRRKGSLAMRAATKESTISLWPEGWPGGNPGFQLTTTHRNSMSIQMLSVRSRNALESDQSQLRARSSVGESICLLSRGSGVSIPSGRAISQM